MHRRPLGLVADSSGRIAIASLVDAFFTLAVERVCDRGVVEPRSPEHLEPNRKQIERQVVEFGDQIAVAAEQLIVAVAIVLEGAHVVEASAGGARRRPLRANRAAQLMESRAPLDRPHGKQL